VQFRHHDVEQHEVWAQSARLAQAFFAIVRAFDFVACGVERLRHLKGDVANVFANQDSAFRVGGSAHEFRKGIARVMQKEAERTEQWRDSDGVPRALHVQWHTTAKAAELRTAPTCNSRLDPIQLRHTPRASHHDSRQHAFPRSAATNFAVVDAAAVADSRRSRCHLGTGTGGLTGTVIAAQDSLFANSFGDFKGVLRSLVVDTGAGYDFYYQLVNTGTDQGIGADFFRMATSALTLVSTCR
jgi:hypothetical protein